MSTQIKTILLTFALLFAIQPMLMSQSDNDGSMRVIVEFAEVRFDYAGINLDDGTGSEEHAIIFYARDRASYDGQSWRGGTTFTHTCSGECGWNFANYRAFDHTYGQNTNIPTQFDVRYRYWEDDCFDCFRCTNSIFGACVSWRCDACSRSVYNNPCGCSNNALCSGCNTDDRLYDISFNNISIRGAAPGWANRGWYDGDGGSGSDRPRVRIESYWTPPRPNFALANGQSGTYTICNGQTVSLSSAGAEWGGVYRWRTSGGTFIGDGNPLSVSPSSTTTYRVWTRNGSLQSMSYRDVTVIVTPTTYVWTGNVSTDWNDGNNWSCNTVPNASSNVVVPQSRPRYPVISNSFAGVDAYCNTIELNITGGASLIVNTNATFSITQ